MAEKKPLLVVIVGPNGSGKSVVTEILRSSYEWSKGLLEINPDKIAQGEFGDWNDPVAVLKAAVKAEEIREECLSAGKSLLNTCDVEDVDEDNAAPFTVFRTVDGLVAKTYVEESRIPLWCLPIRKGLQPTA